MLVPATRPRPPARRGAILLVVLTLLALFSVVALSFALYAEAEATSSRIKRESVSDRDAVPPDITPALNQFLSQILFDTADGGQDATSAFRGHSLARLMHGAHPTSSNQTPYNGIGTFADPGIVTGLARQHIINYSLQSGTLAVIDPEHTGSRTAGTAAAAGSYPTSTYVGKNGPYTYPDRNNMAVAVMNPATGEVLVPSFHRYGPPTGAVGFFNAGNNNPLTRLAPPAAVAANTDWTSNTGYERYILLRPRPFDHTYNSGDGRGAVTDFPYPPMNPDGSYTGDVQNWTFTTGTQRNDSIWMWANLPTTTYRGKRIVPLVAPLIVPLDGRINLNVAGNMLAAGDSHTSNQGFGPWEQNLSLVLKASTGAEEARRQIAWRVANNQAAAASGSPDSSFPGAVTTTRTATARGTTPSATRAAFARLFSNDYARVDWDAVNATGMLPEKLTLPTGFASDPTWPANRYSNSDPATEQLNHPSLFSPYVWADGAFGRTVRLDQYGSQLFQYSARPNTFADPANPLAQLMPDSFGGTYQATPVPARRYSGPGDPSNQARALTTPISNSLKRPVWSPGFAQAGSFVWTNPAAFPTTTPGDSTAGTRTMTAPAAVVGTTDLAGANEIRAAVAALGAVNLNRTLADYRTQMGMGSAISPNPAMLNYAAATQDRQQLAQDVFARLVYVTGAYHRYPFDPATRTFTLGAAVPADMTLGATPEQLAAVRWLAQLAANVVDYVDNDDVSTTFVWNPEIPGASPDPSDPTFPQYQSNFAPTKIANRVVFGVEKPRVVLNEAYAELVNDPTDVGMNATRAFHARFWFELLNPGTTQSNPTGPIGTGDAKLYYVAADGAPVPYSVYRIQVFNNGAIGATGTDATFAFNRLTGVAANVTGDATSTTLVLPAPPPPAAVPQIDIDLSGTAVQAPSYRRITPNGGAAQAPAQNEGFAVVGPDTTADPAGTKNFRPDQTQLIPPSGVIAVPDTGPPGNRMYFQVQQTTQGQIPMAVTKASDSVVLLRRLACPYLQPNDPLDTTVSFNPALPANPYLTVDYTSAIPARDAVKKGTDSTAMMTNNPAGGSSVGRPQPFFGAQQHLQLQTTQNPVNGYATPNLRETLFKHNDATQVPFDWMTHLDRPLVNAVELRHVAACPAHELTQKFARPQTPPSVPPVPPVPSPLPVTAVDKHKHAADWFDPNTLLYRAFETLTVKPWTAGVPEGGRTPGRVNVNMIWNKEVLRALLDPQSANEFNTTMMPGYVDNLWTALFAGNPGTSVARSKSFPGVGATYDETGTPGNVDDRPFKSFGVSPLASNVGGLVPYGSGIDDTLLRRDPMTGLPVLSLPFVPTTREHPLQLDETARKLMNNVTTVSDTYMVIFTIGYFEVRGDTAIAGGVTVPVLGKEVFLDTPGDMRVKFGAVVDRTNLNLGSALTAAAVTAGTTTVTVNATGTAFKAGQMITFGTGTMAETRQITVVADNAPTPTITLTFAPAVTNNHPAGEPVSLPQPGVRPWFADLVSPVTAGVPGTYYIQFVGQSAGGILYDGQGFPINNNDLLLLGTGASAEWVRITGIGATDPALGALPGYAPATGVITVQVQNLSAGPPRAQPSGTAVSNTVLGNPGPQPNFNVKDDKYKPIVPLFVKLSK